MNKEESAALLGRSVRQLERLVSAKRITAYKVKTAKGQVADFHVEDLERLKSELEEEEGRVVVSSGENQSSPPSAEMVLATPRRATRQPLPQDSSVLATVPRAEIVAVDATSSQSISPVFPAVFAASLRSLLTIADVCELSQLSEKRVRDALRAGDLKGKKIGHGWRVRRNDFDAWIEQLI